MLCGIFENVCLNGTGKLFLQINQMYVSCLMMMFVNPELDTIEANDNTTQNYTSIDAAWWKNHTSGCADADESSKQEFSNIYSLHGGVCVYLFGVYSCSALNTLCVYVFRRCTPKVRSWPVL